jgi:hypothetical protein
VSTRSRILALFGPTAAGKSALAHAAARALDGEIVVADPFQRYRGLETTACAPCHADPHKREFIARDNGECGPCHSVAGFVPTTFGLAAHSTTAFVLDGKHVATPCGACHTATRPRTDFRVPNRACADCHQNPHGEQFATEMKQTGCATCHATADWHQPTIDHSAWPLLGAHQRTACAACRGAVSSSGAVLPSGSSGHSWSRPAPNAWRAASKAWDRKSSMQPCCLPRP